jgi:hypothetical protein
LCFEAGANAVHRTARLPEIDCLESGRRPPDRPKMPLGFLNDVKQRVSVWIGRGQRRRERALNRDKGGCQMTPMVGRACWRAQVSQAFGRFANPFASALYRLVVHDCAGAGDRTL